MSAVAVTPRRDEIPGFIVEYPAMGNVVRSKEKNIIFQSTYRGLMIQEKRKNQTEGYCFDD